MTKLGVTVVKKDPELMVYTFLSAVFSIVASVAIISGSIGIDAITSADSAEDEDVANAATLALVFVGYLIVSVITVFWNAAIIASAYERLTTGTNPSFSYGIGQSMKCLPQIMIWGVISGTVGLFLKILEGLARDSDAPPPLRIIAGLAAFVIGVAWWMATFFVVPMMVLEKAGVIDSLKDSPKMFKQTWGEDVGSHVGTGLLQFLVLVVICLIVIPFALLGEYGMIFGMALLILGVGLSAIFFATVESVNRASLYYYAKTGEMPPMAQKYGIEF